MKHDDIEENRVHEIFSNVEPKMKYYQILQKRGIISTSLRQISDQASANLSSHFTIKMPSSIPVNLPKHSKSRINTVISLGKLADQPFASNKFKRMVWSIRSAADGSSVNSPPPPPPSTNGGSGTRLIRAFQSLQFKLIARLKELRKNLPAKLFSFLVGFYCATAFATVIGQTGDWDVLSAALAVVVVEGIGALMYKGSLPSVFNLRNLIVIFNYWKAGLILGLFLDSFKY
ncbi:hypothetical protein ACJIZ3_003862 [Penstemon smallii]|uniref:Ycf20-like protein n=1 Tax=Penstemon smallii TaxID=265156 RepID=A0ABD3S0H5_9LAMI